MAEKPPAQKIGRDARTDEYIPVKEAERRPSTTVIETRTPAVHPQRDSTFDDLRKTLVSTATVGALRRCERLTD